MPGDADRDLWQGIGASVAANKPLGPARPSHTIRTRNWAQEHDDMNVPDGRVSSERRSRSPVRAFVSAAFSGNERHVRRLQNVMAIERRSMNTQAPEAASALPKLYAGARLVRSSEMTNPVRDPTRSSDSRRGSITSAATCCWTARCSDMPRTTASAG
jgi:hypothetical protein